MGRRGVVVGGVLSLMVTSAVVAGFMGFATPAFSSSGVKEAPLVRVASVERQNLVQQVTVMGVLEPDGLQEVRAAFQAGKVRFLVGAGDRIKAGQALVELDRGLQLEAIAGLESALAKAEAHLATLRWEQALEPTRSRQKVTAAEVALAEAEREYQEAVAAVTQQLGKARLAVLGVQGRQATLTAQLEEAKGRLQQAESAYRADPTNAEAAQYYRESQLALETLQITAATMAKQLEEELTQAQQELRAAEQSAAPENLEKQSSVRAALLQVEGARQALAAAQYEAAAGVVLPEHITAAQADVNMTRQMLATARLRLEQAVIKAPFDGVVVSVALKEGQPVQANEVLLGLSSTNQLTLKAQVDEKDVAKVEAGQDFAVVSSNYPGEVFTGKILRVPVLPAKGDASSPGTYFAVQGVLQNPGGKLRPGMAVEAVITSGTRTAVPTVSLEAIREFGGKTYALVVKDFVVDLRPVTLGLRAEKQVEVLNGVEEGEVVVVSPTRMVQSLKDGESVRVDAVAR